MRDLFRLILCTVILRFGAKIPILIDLKGQC
jgi:hypothetical protein